MKLKNLIILVATAWFAASCYYDNAEELYQNYNQTCDTSVVSFAQDVMPIIDNACVSCHGNISPSAGLTLTDYGTITASLQKVEDRINRPNGDPLVMPQSGPMIRCNIDKINAWINQGAMDN